MACCASRPPRTRRSFHMTQPPQEILLASEELKIMWKLRRVLGGLDAQQAIELLIDRLKKTRTNYEFLTQVQATSGSRLDDES